MEEKPYLEEKTDREKLWQGIAAAVLSILVTGLGHLYLGVAKRGYILLGSTAVFFFIGRVYWPLADMFYIQFAIIFAVDAFSFAKRGHGLF
ncbi:MAG: hypothetical protein GKS05_11410 [Nitrospirales bacterium]|nr:hypothetical protein [Nitrospirales bacterium]